jgi:hypothetical protein
MAAVQPEPWLRVLITNINNNKWDNKKVARCLKAGNLREDQNTFLTPFRSVLLRMGEIFEANM